MQNSNLKIKKIPMRQCLGCNVHKPKNELVRVVRLPDGGVMLDTKGKISGRGAYICHSPSCLKKAVKSKRIEHILECEIPDEVYEAMKKKIAEETEA